MHRASRQEVILKFFPELQTLGTSARDAECISRFGTAAGRLILTDMLFAFRNAFNERGPGILVIRHNDDGEKGDVAYMTLSELTHDLDTAYSYNDTDAAAFLSDAISQVEGLNPDKLALFMLVESRGVAIVPVPVDEPEAGIRAIFEEVTS
jgi:hypothetical protein